jgi:hypothetical protein
MKTVYFLSQQDGIDFHSYRGPDLRHPLQGPHEPSHAPDALSMDRAIPAAWTALQFQFYETKILFIITENYCI